MGETLQYNYSIRTSTPTNSTANEGHQALARSLSRLTETGSREVSPLARCSSSSLPVSGSSEGQGTDVVEPSSKKPRISAPNSTLNMKSGYCGTASKIECKVKPQPGFLSQLRRHNQRMKLKDYVGNGALPGQFSTTELSQLGVSPELISVTSSNAGSFRFSGRKYFSEAVLSSEEGVRTEDGGVLHAGADGCVGLEQIQRAFLSTSGVDSQLIGEQWIANHYRWLVWKLAAMEVAFPRQFAGRCLTPDWLLCQLKYRYDREIDNSHRSALKKIMERDDISSRTLVLCVSSVTVREIQLRTRVQGAEG
ncbi:Breast cancer 2, early onset [Desmophyllum pertusum]|uniref:Breast cancer 2, early onset n=1 Tax=Desmophyllum pertusum TaxID=174260 RepID=A0A9X0CRY8_9CNID|nr:Breast cancer 2, early onset [Desmophyllum pertusum]